VSSSHHDDDAELRRRFGELRDREGSERPEFEMVVKRARTRVDANSVQLRRRIALTAAAAIVIAAVGVGVARKREQSAAIARAAQIQSLPSWSTPTASLLRTPGSERLRTVPRLSESMIDRAIPSIHSEESGS
jgi:hypothetical protein